MMTKEEIVQKARVWSLRLALAQDDNDWNEVGAVCGEINAAYCDLVYGKAEEGQTALECIVRARKVMDQDAHLANYMVRDLPETKAAGLSDLAWAMHRESPSCIDVAYLLDALETFIRQQEEVEL